MDAIAFGTGTVRPAASAAAEPQSTAEVLWEQMTVDGQSFWTAVYPLFIDRELTKTDLRQLIKAGLQRTQGSYRKLVELFRMPPGDYKRFLAFLYQHDCHLPFHEFREPRTEEPAGAVAHRADSHQRTADSLLQPASAPAPPTRPAGI